MFHVTFWSPAYFQGSFFPGLTEAGEHLTRRFWGDEYVGRKDVFFSQGTFYKVK